jgi:hypothetical protein
MLVDLDLDAMRATEYGTRVAALRAADPTLTYDPFAVMHIDRGMYFAHGLDHLLQDCGILAQAWPYDAMFEGGDTPESRLAYLCATWEDPTHPETYGSCDYPMQVIEKYPRIETDDRRLVVAFTYLRRDNQQDGGWRWHKNGPYVGNFKPQCEYLGDEPIVEEVYTFHLHEVV